MALTRTEIDRAYLQRHNLKRFNLMAAEGVLRRFKELAQSKDVRPGEMLEMLLDAYQRPSQKDNGRKEKESPKPTVPSAPGVDQMALF